MEDCMQKLLDTKPDKVVCVVSIEEEETTNDGRKVGALKIIGRGPEPLNAGVVLRLRGVLFLLVQIYILK
jgi:hypothetical protein